MKQRYTAFGFYQLQSRLSDISKSSVKLMMPYPLVNSEVVHELAKEAEENFKFSKYVLELHKAVHTEFKKLEKSL